MLLNQFLSGYLSFLGKVGKIKVVQKKWHWLPIIGNSIFVDSHFRQHIRHFAKMYGFRRPLRLCAKICCKKIITLEKKTAVSPINQYCFLLNLGRRKNDCRNPKKKRSASRLKSNTCCIWWFIPCTATRKFFCANWFLTVRMPLINYVLKPCLMKSCTKAIANWKSVSLLIKISAPSLLAITALDTRAEVQEHIGTIAKSGTKQFFEALTGEQAKDSELIGQLVLVFIRRLLLPIKLP